MLSALVLVGSVATTTDAFAQERCPSPSSPDDARQLAARAFEEGQSFFENENCSAIERFQCSFELYPHPSTLFNVGRSAEQCGRVELAVSSYRRFLELYADNAGRAEVEARLRAVEERASALERRVDQLEARSSAPPEPEPDDESNPEHATSGDEEPEPRAHTGLSPSAARAIRLAGWVGLGVGGALMLTSFGLMGGAASHHAKLDEYNHLPDDERTDDEAWQAYADQGHALDVSGWVLFGLGGVVLVTGVVLAVLSRLRWNISEERSAATPQPWMLAIAADAAMW